MPMPAAAAVDTPLETALRGVLVLVDAPLETALRGVLALVDAPLETVLRGDVLVLVDNAVEEELILAVDVVGFIAAVADIGLIVGAVDEVVD
jgi:hypothetical protein